ncbi:MAG: phosphotransferase [Proteobacteria bacterium]|nr:phosphotransferase [Pseudomonadota bacterium]
MSAASSAVAEAAGLAGAYSPVPEAKALELLHEAYGLTGTLKRFATEKDDTFRVATGTGQDYVLKIANPDESFGEIDFQNCILHEVARQDPGLPVPRVVASKDGQDVFLRQGGACQDRYVRVLTFLDGTPLCDTIASDAERAEIGKVLARLRLAMAGVSHDSESRLLAWDVQHLLRLEHLLGDVADTGKRAQLMQGLERFRTLEPDVRRLRQQVLHNDFSQSNIVVDAAHPGFIKGIIDFGDSAKTAIAIDVSTALLNQLPRVPQGDLFAQARDLLKGYLSIATLTEEELRLIPHLVMARIVARALITLWRARLFPENQTYILRNTEQGWHQLDWFLARSVNQVSDELMIYAKKGTS